ncbi:unnamed protein product [Caenorhabditis auriculariae]|uniref:Uncharacterized protein n=1 Tax=Caenorhabditis auriculariae TaxID=2777116 RepID=A0A8S1GS96_9PELO|nr:unnamed protein product [Caenorhabditis auriculariae]
MGMASTRIMCGGGSDVGGWKKTRHTRLPIKNRNAKRARQQMNDLSVARRLSARACAAAAVDNNHFVRKACKGYMTN